MVYRSIPPVVPLDHDPTSRILPVIIAVMTFIAILAATAFIVISDVTRAWQSDLGNRLTIQLPAVQSEVDQDRYALAIDALNSTPGVRQAYLMETEELRALIEPWIGEVAARQSLPIPQLIDVILAENTPIDLGALEVRVRQVVPEAVVDVHRVWVQSILKTIVWFEILALVVCALIAAAAAGTVITITRAGLAFHRSIFDILYVIGAKDSYIAKQFQNHAFVLSLRGGIAGFVIGAITILALEWSIVDLSQTLLPPIHIHLRAWLILMSIPILAVIISAITARQTVLHTLKSRS